ncbi:MAG: HU family DNA-binding protein [Pseudomonadota bacterium]
MNKAQLIDEIARYADLSNAASSRALEAVISSVKNSLSKGESLSLIGFGTFYVASRAARTGRNPRTGVAVKIEASVVPKFRAGKALKDALK